MSQSRRTSARIASVGKSLMPRYVLGGSPTWPITASVSAPRPVRRTLASKGRAGREAAGRGPHTPRLEGQREQEERDAVHLEIADEEERQQRGEQRERQRDQHER